MKQRETGPARARDSAKTKLLDAALRVIRTKGYEATTVDELCAAAAVSKGSFFHHFASKEELAVGAAAHFGAMANGLFAGAPYRGLADPRARVLAYIDFRSALLTGSLPEITCLLGTMVQETYATHPAIREACEAGICGHAADVARDIALAKERHAPDAPWTPESLALYTQAVIQGAFILAKASNDPHLAGDALTHLRRYLETQLPNTTQQ
ncbi:MAG: TetR/AcrR family transcriptional regulator [Vulcanimicrobiaceae bacterium]|jgi:TetR/AcrR family transcriptional repressor of nem operon